MQLQDKGDEVISLMIADTVDILALVVTIAGIACFVAIAAVVVG